MRYAVATWNFMAPGVSLPDLLGRFADLGFDAMSFLPRQVLALSPADREALLAILDERRLAATVHGDFSLAPDDASRLLNSLGERLLSLTMDAAYAEDSRGMYFDAARMARLLGHIEAASRGTALRFGVEDFPLDAMARDTYAAPLAPLLGCPRFGALIDLGHMNLRRCRHEYFKGRSVAAYLAAVPVPIIEVHVHDNAGDRDSHAPLGDGTLDFAAAARGLRQAGFDGVSTVEIAPSLHGGDRAAEVPRTGEGLALWRRLWGSAR